jgi:membrane protease YdiL (CAAX protease family)
MSSTSKHSPHELPVWKIILFILACIGLFVLIAIVCDVVTSWIEPILVRIVIRELVLRTGLTIYVLDVFATRVIKAYDPSSIYGRPTLYIAGKWIIYGLLLPVIVWLLYYLLQLVTPYQHTIIMNSADKMQLLMKWSAISVAAGLTEEVLFRGHLLMILRSRFSDVKSIIASSFIFGVVHIFMLPIITPVDIVIVIYGGIIAGSMFACVYLYTKVIWYAAIVHILWDIFFIGKITAVVVGQADANQTVMAFKLNTQNILVNGGNFGLEAGLPCLIVCMATAAIIYYLYKKDTLGNSKYLNKL